jgi:hypothetical protein
MLALSLAVLLPYAIDQETGGIDEILDLPVRRF